MAKKPVKPRVLKPYGTYKFSGQDPATGKVLDELDGEKISAIASASGVSPSTFMNWRKKKTKRPQFATLNAALRAVGKEFVIGNTR
jgi:hypothetical protein